MAGFVPAFSFTTMLCSRLSRGMAGCRPMEVASAGDHVKPYFIKLPRRLQRLFARKMPDTPGSYKAYVREFDIEVDADEIDSVLGPLSEEHRADFAAACRTFHHGLAAWRTAVQFSSLDAISDIRRACPDDALNDTAVTLLVDHSGSMRGHRILLAAAAVDVLTDLLSLLGVAVEILGFTTVGWQGGKSRELWKACGSPAKPGRLADLLHIVYRPLGVWHLGTPRNLQNMLRPELLKENIDGEAIEWAAERLRASDRLRKLLVVVSDGAPVDDSTILANNDTYLLDHLKRVLADLQDTGDIKIVALGLGYSVENYYPQSVKIGSPEDLGGALLTLIRECLAELSIESRPQAH